MTSEFYLPLTTGSLNDGFFASIEEDTAEGATCEGVIAVWLATLCPMVSPGCFRTSMGLPLGYRYERIPATRRESAFPMVTPAIAGTNPRIMFPLRAGPGAAPAPERRHAVCAGQRTVRIIRCFSAMAS